MFKPIYNEELPNDERIIQRLDNLYDMIRNGLQGLNLICAVILIILAVHIFNWKW